MAVKKVRYQSRSVEHHVAAPRTDVWPAVTALLGNGHWSVQDLSVEPPWRMAVELSRHNTDLVFLQSTVLIRDDGDSCHVAWALVFDPEPSQAGMAVAERLLDEMRAELQGLAKQFG